MTDKIHFDLVSPERMLLSEDVDLVTLPGAAGYFGVLPGHAPRLSSPLFRRGSREEGRRR